MGEILRSEAKRNTPAGFRLRQILATGALVGDDIVCDVVGARLQTDGVKGGASRNALILDGFPRNIRQAAFLDSQLADLGMPRPTVIHLDISKDRLLCRLSGRRQCAVCGTIYNLSSRPSMRGSRCENDGGALVQRDDDSEGVILQRLEDFEASLPALIDYYQGCNYHRISADRDPDIIAEDLECMLGHGAPSRQQAAHAA